MVSDKILLSYTYWKITFTFHTDSSDKQLGSVINQNNKPIAFLSRRLIIHNVTTEKELFAIVE